MATIPYGDVHLASAEVDSFNTIALLTGDTPPIVTMAEVAGADLKQWQVVGRDAATGKVVPAVLGTTEAIGVAVNSVAVDKSVAVYRAGCFNPKALIWDASYDTDAKKKIAFEKTGTQIFVVAPIY